MLITVSGLVLRETRIGDMDKIITVLTKEYGRISVSAKGSKSLKSKMLAGTQLFAYSEFTLYCSKGKYSVNDADLKESFYGIRQDVERFALAAYIAQLACELAPENEECAGLLSLTLNAFHLLANGLREPGFVKAVYELRAYSAMGFQPDLVACGDCAVYEDEVMYFSPSEGRLWCKGCFEGASVKPEDAVALSPFALYAARFIVFSEDKKIFSFKLPEPFFSELYRLCESYVATQAGHGFSTLDFYNSVKG